MCYCPFLFDRSGTSEVSDVIVESPVKDVEPPEVVPELETDTNKPPRQFSKSNSRPNQLSGGWLLYIPFQCHFICPILEPDRSI